MQIGFLHARTNKQYRRLASRTNTKLTRSQQRRALFLRFPFLRRCRIPFGNKHTRTHTQTRPKRPKKKHKEAPTNTSATVPYMNYVTAGADFNVVSFESGFFFVSLSHRHYLDANVMSFIFLSFHFISYFFYFFSKLWRSFVCERPSQQILA